MVYFITDGRYTKIGCANDPAKRLLELQTGNPLELSLIKTIKGSFEEEMAIHKSLSLYHVRGEWYDFNQFDDCVLEFLLEGNCGLVNQKTKSYDLIYHNSVRSFNSKKSFISSYEVARELYGDVCIDDIASVMGVNVASARRVLSKIKEVGEGVDKPNPDINNKKYITTQRKIIVGGEEIHFKDKEFITKSRVSRKASVSRPTVNNHWDNVSDYFEELNSNLKTEKQSITNKD